jgi:hypothetical protein
MGDDSGARTAKDDRAEVMVRVMMGQNQPFDRLRRGGSNGSEETLAVPGTGQRVNHHHALGGYDEPSIRATFRTPVGITQDCINPGREDTGRKRGWRCARRSTGRGVEQKSSQNERKMEGHASRVVPEGTAGAARGQAAVKAMLTDCLKEPPLLSVQAIVSGASLSALRVKLTTGSRLMPEVHSNRAISSAP